MQIHNSNVSTRAAFLSTLSMAAFPLLLPNNAFAQDDQENTIDEPTITPEPITTTTTTTSTVTPGRTIEGCPKPTANKANNCVATANIKQLDTYSPPWTYEVTPEEAFARLKGLIAYDTNTYTVLESDDNARYLKVNAKYSFNTNDIMEFIVKGGDSNDKVVIFKSYEEQSTSSSLSDFGRNRKRLDDLRLQSKGIFTQMGEGLMTADTFDGGARGKRNGPLGQLKAFYGLQNGGGGFIDDE